MKVLKKILKITAIGLIVLLLLAFTIPVLFKKQITRLVKKEINRNLTAKVDFSDVHLSLFRHFPRVTIVLNDLSIVGADEFAGDTLIYAKTLDASANLFNVLKGKNINIYGAYLKSPRIHAFVKADGRANWDILKTTAGGTDTSASTFKLSLKSYSISNGYIEYSDEQAHTHLIWNEVDHRGSGDFTEDEFTLSTITHAKGTDLTQDAIPWLVNTRTDIITDIRINNNTQTYTFNTEKLSLNDLNLSLQGYFQVVDDGTFNMDLKFQSPGSQFKNLLSLIPDIYARDFNKLEASGDAAFAGFVKGSYGGGRSPAYDISLAVKNGSFKYPELPHPVKNIQFDLRASNPDGIPDNAMINISEGHFEMDKEPVDFRFILRKPGSAQYIDAAAKGRIDLSRLSEFIRLGAGRKISGLVHADAYVKGNISAIERLQPFAAGGFFEIKNLFYSDRDLAQPLRNGNMNIKLENSGGLAEKTTITVPAGHIELGNNPLDFSLLLRNPFSALDFTGRVKGNIALDQLQQFFPPEPGISMKGSLSADMGFSGNKSMFTGKEYDKLLLNGTARLADLDYHSKVYPEGFRVSEARLRFDNKTVNLDQLNANYLHTEFSASGVMNNLAGFLMNGQTLTGNLAVRANEMNLNNWIGSSVPDSANSVTQGSPQPFQLPAHVDLSLQAAVARVNYDKVNYDNVRGLVLLREEKLVLQDLKTEALDGTITMNGSYSTLLNKKEPDIGFSYDITHMDIRKAFLAFNTVQSLMPIAKFLSGKLNSQVSLVGRMNGDMSPKLMSLTGKGNLLLLEGVLKEFAPLEKLATLLQVEQLRSISIKDIKNYIEFANGRVLVKPFTLSIGNIEMQVSGFHGFDQSIDYAIQMKLPRSLMGSKGNGLVNDLAAKAGNKGIPLKLGETINLDIKMTGTVSNPYIGINLKGMVDDVVKDMEQQAKEFVQAKLDSAKQKTKDSLEAVKKLLEDKLKDRIRDQIFGKDTTNANNPDSGKRKPTDIIKNTIKGILNRKKNVPDTGGN